MDGNAFKQVGDAAVGLITLMAWTLVLCLPLALWKAIEIIIWLFNHVYIGVSF